MKCLPFLHDYEVIKKSDDDVLDEIKRRFLSHGDMYRECYTDQVGNKVKVEWMRKYIPKKPKTKVCLKCCKVSSNYDIDVIVDILTSRAAKHAKKLKRAEAARLIATEL